MKQPCSSTRRGGLIHTTSFPQRIPVESDLADSLYADAQGRLIAPLNASPQPMCLHSHFGMCLCERYRAVKRGCIITLLCRIFRLQWKFHYMLTWCSSAGYVCWADWLGCQFNSSSISYLLHIKRHHQWFILYTAAPSSVNAFINILICSWQSNKTVYQSLLHFCLESQMIVLLYLFLLQMTDKNYNN